MVQKRGAPQLIDDIFKPRPKPDKYLRVADQRSGAYSILAGVVSNRSMRTRQVVQIADLVHDIGHPDYPTMPSPDEPLR
ncbi:MAG: hypothetical protein MUQ65_06870 [Armatimonadetes bacterium]|nr:hypothetical protein [Armatimonadota bacterium]